MRPRGALRSAQAEDGHHLARGGDVEAAFAGCAVERATQAGDDVPQGAVIQVDQPGHVDAARVERRGVELDGIVDQGDEQVLGRGDGVEIAGQSEVDPLEGLEPRVAAAGPAALAAERRPQRRLAQRRDRSDAAGAKTVGQADRDGGLSLAGGRRGDGRDQHQLARQLGVVIPGGFGEGRGRRELSDALAILDVVVFGQAQLLRAPAQVGHRG